MRAPLMLIAASFSLWAADPAADARRDSSGDFGVMPFAFRTNQIRGFPKEIVPQPPKTAPEIPTTSGTTFSRPPSTFSTSGGSFSRPASTFSNPTTGASALPPGVGFYTRVPPTNSSIHGPNFGTTSLSVTPGVSTTTQIQPEEAILSVAETDVPVQEVPVEPRVELSPTVSNPAMVLDLPPGAIIRRPVAPPPAR